MALIQLDQVCLSYDFPILKNISFSINSGEYIGLVGPNGAGKTSLLKIILGITPPNRGKVHRQKDLKVGYVPQYIFPKNPFIISVKEVMELALRRKSFWRRENEITQFEEKLNWVGLNQHFLNREFHTLSGGQQQKVIIAKALLNNPDLLLFDEPLSGVDYQNKLQIYELLAKINQDHHTTILIVSHEIHSVIDRCKRVLCLDKEIYEGCHPIDFIKKPSNFKQNKLNSTHEVCPIHNIKSNH